MSTPTNLHALAHTTLETYEVMMTHRHNCGQCKIDQNALRPFCKTNQTYQAEFDKQFTEWFRLRRELRERAKWAASTPVANGMP